MLIKEIDIIVVEEIEAGVQIINQEDNIINNMVCDELH